MKPFLPLLAFYAWIHIDQTGLAHFIGPEDGLTIVNTVEEAQAVRNIVIQYVVENPGKAKLIELEMRKELETIEAGGEF